MKTKLFFTSLIAFLFAAAAFVACQKDVLTPNPALNAVMQASHGGNVTCEEAALANGLTGYEFTTGKMDYVNGMFLDEYGNEITDFNGLSIVTNGTYITWTMQPNPGYCLEMAVIVKGGDAANVYYYNFEDGILNGVDLHSPLNASNNPAELSNLTFCWTWELCEGENPNPVCVNWITETAYAGDMAGAIVKGKDGNAAWWQYFDINGNATQNIYAGQTTLVGTATYDAPAGTITLNLTNGWELNMVEGENTVKWYSTNTLPTTGRPTPGLAPNQGNDLVINVSTDQYYIIHLDVKKCTLWDNEVVL